MATKFVFNPFSGTFDLINSLTSPIQYIGLITVAADFPTTAEVQSGWLYIINADVTDNNPAKTNTGLSFKQGDEIIWNGSTWDILGNELMYVKKSGDTMVGSLTAPNFISNVAIGTSPYACTSTTLNSNLNADLWDGYQFSDYLNQAVKTTSSPTFANITDSGLTSGRVPYASTGGLLIDSANFTYDGTTLDLDTGGICAATYEICDLVGDYKLISDANDYSRHGYNGTGGTYANQWLLDSTATFTSQIANYATLSAITITGNLRFSDDNIGGNTIPLLLLTGASSRQFAIGASIAEASDYTGKIKIRVHNGTSVILLWKSTADYNTNIPIHIVFRTSSAGNEIWIDGVKDTGTYTTGSASTNIAFNQVSGWTAMTAGANVSAGEMAISNVSIYSRYLTDLEVKRIYFNDRKNIGFGDIGANRLGVGIAPQPTSIVSVYKNVVGQGEPPIYRGVDVNLAGLSNASSTRRYAFYGSLVGDSAAKTGIYCAFPGRTVTGDFLYWGVGATEEGASTYTYYTTGTGQDYYQWNFSSQAKLWAFGNLGEGFMYMGADDRKTFWGTSEKVSAVCDGHDFVINPKENSSTYNTQIQSDLTVASLASLGAEKLTNNNFAAGTGSWTLGAAWAWNSETWAGGTGVDKVNVGTTTLSQTSAAMVTPLVIGETYRLEIQLAYYDSGTFTASCGGWTSPTMTGLTPSGVQMKVKHWAWVFTATSTATLTFTPSSTAVFTIGTDYTRPALSLKKVLAGDLYVAGSLLTTGIRKAVTTKTTNYTATANDEVIICNSTTAFTITLPVASGNGRSYFIKNINTGIITIDGNSSDTIDGVTTQTINRWECLQIVDYAANAWIVI